MERKVIEKAFLNTRIMPPFNNKKNDELAAGSHGKVAKLGASSFASGRFAWFQGVQN